MIVEQQLQVFSGFQAVIEAAAAGGCRAYYASPSPLHAQLLNEGARRFHQLHGSFVQAAHPVDALSMALGASQMGVLPMVSGNFPDFLAMQEVLQACFRQECPCVIAVLLYQEPAWSPPALQAYNQANQTTNQTSSQASPLAFAYPCFLDPWPAAGLPMISLMPASLSRLYELTQQACQLSLAARQPVAILLDPLLLPVTGDLPMLAPEPLHLPHSLPEGENWLERLDASQQALLPLASQWLRQWSGTASPEYCLLATGLLGGWLLEMEWPRGSVFVPESLFPFAVEDLPETPVYVVEFAPSNLGRRLQQRFPGRDVRSLTLPWERSAPAGLKAAICKQLEADGYDP